MPAAKRDVTGVFSQRSGFPTLGSHRQAAPFSVARVNTAGPLLLRESHARSRRETKVRGKEQGFLVIVFFMVLFTEPVTT